MSVCQSLGRLHDLPRVRLGHGVTPLEPLERLGTQIGEASLWVKRDDCSGLAFGGNKVRQLEFYLGEALEQGADTVLITSAVQSNFVRLTAAACAQLGLDCHVQLEERVPEVHATYRDSGNVLLDKLFGAHIYHYPEGEDEAGADRAIAEIGRSLQRNGQKPYQIALAPNHPPLGALGYVCAAEELLGQCARSDLSLDAIVVASGSGHTHAGLLFGLRALGYTGEVFGVCVRRAASLQHDRIVERCEQIASLLGCRSPVTEDDVNLDDRFLAPGYGRLNEPTLSAIQTTARSEALLLDPVYTGKAMAGFLALAGSAEAGACLGFVHTGGLPALFAYEPELAASIATG